MSHQPECPCARQACAQPASLCTNCNCLDLRLAYHRGRRDAYRKAMEEHNVQMAQAIKDAAEGAYRYGLVQAREAVAAVDKPRMLGKWYTEVLDEAVAAIDALRGGNG